jgi:hypothetical protein
MQKGNEEAVYKLLLRLQKRNSELERKRVLPKGKLVACPRLPTA